MIFGENLLALLVLALGGALAVGNLLALVRPRAPGDDELAEGSEDDGEFLERPPLGRSLVMIAIGTVATIWALASLVSGGDEPTEPTAQTAVQTTTSLINEHRSIYDRPADSDSPN